MTHKEKADKSVCQCHSTFSSNIFSIMFDDHSYASIPQHTELFYSYKCLYTSIIVRKQNALTLSSEIVEESDFIVLITLHTLVMWGV